MDMYQEEVLGKHIFVQKQVRKGGHWDFVILKTETVWQEKLLAKFGSQLAFAHFLPMRSIFNF